MNKCFLLNPEKNLAQICLAFSRKTQKNAPLIPTNDVNEPKARLLPVKRAVNRLKVSFKLLESMVSGSLLITC